MSSIAIVWLRRDLRLHHNPALQYAVNNFDQVVALFHLDEQDERPLGQASKLWLYHSLVSLQKSLAAKNISLVASKDFSSLDALQSKAQELEAKAIFWNRTYEPQLTERDREIKEKLSESYEVKSFAATALIEPMEVFNKAGDPFRVFTPFYKASLIKLEEQLNNIELSFFDEIRAATQPLKLESHIDELGLITNTKEYQRKLKDLPKIAGENFKCTNWTQILEHWQIGEQAALETFHDYLDDGVEEYNALRDFPAIKGISKLSPSLHFGEISPLYMAKKLLDHERDYPNHLRTNNSNKGDGSASFRSKAGKYLRQLFWRDFNSYIIFHFPHSATEELQPKFKDFPWDNNSEMLGKWQRGETGYPIVDAGMKELWATGWMHNRVRMIVASFLVKDLFIDWRYGEEWFWDTLFDADLGNNIMGWQWTAGCGADAAPYFRVFNPLLQSEKFDKEANYIRKWLPELAKLPNKWIHKPAEAPSAILAIADVKLGETYPYPIVDHSQARDKALSIFKTLSSEAVAK